MAKETLPANFKDDILASEMGGKRRYKITFPDGTEQEVMLEDVTNYDQVGSNFGAAQVNQINTAINESLGKTDDASNVINTFSAAGTRTNLTSKEKLSVSLGKIMKWFSDLKNGAFHTVANNLTTSDANYVLDARQGKALNDAKLDKTGNASNVTNTFTQATARNQLTSGEKLSVSLGKIMKFFADLKSGAYSTVVNNLTTTAAGYALDARQGKVLNDKITSANANLTALLSTRVRSYANGWGSNLTIPEGGRFHGIVIIDHLCLYLVWVAGNTGSKRINSYKIVDQSTADSPSFIYNEAKHEIYISVMRNAAITYIGL